MIVSVAKLSHFILKSYISSIIILITTEAILFFTLNHKYTVPHWILCTVCDCKWFFFCVIQISNNLQRIWWLFPSYFCGKCCLYLKKKSEFQHWQLVIMGTFLKVIREGITKRVAGEVFECLNSSFCIIDFSGTFPIGFNQGSTTPYKMK